MAGRRRGFETLGDMVRSLGLVLVVVAVLVLITLRPPGEEVRVVDYAQTLRLAGAGAPFPPADAVGLPEGWRATSAYFDPPQRTGSAGVVRWHIGWLTPRDEYAAVEQGNGDAAALLEEQLGQAQPAGASTVGGQAWQRNTGTNGRRALTLASGDVLTVVHGTADWGELEQLAAALRPLPS